MSLDVGKGDLGKGDLGKGDLGKGDLGKGDLGKGDLGKGDLGKGDLGKGDLGKATWEAGPLPGQPVQGGRTRRRNGGRPGKNAAERIFSLRARVECFDASLGSSGILTSWKAPNIGGVTRYSIYRVPGARSCRDSHGFWCRESPLDPILRGSTP